MISDVSLKLSTRYISAVPHTHNDMPRHTNGTGFAPVRVTNEVPGAVESCVQKSDTSRQAERQHSAWTAVGPADIPRYPQEPRCIGPTW